MKAMNYNTNDLEDDGSKGITYEEECNELVSSNLESIVPSPPREFSDIKFMLKIPYEEVDNFKKVIYNELVEDHNNPKDSNLVQPFCGMKDKNGKARHGFRFNPRQNPERKLPELYVKYTHKEQLEEVSRIIPQPFLDDLYKFYLRGAIELLSKYFEKRDQYIFLYSQVPLFIPSGSLVDALERIGSMKQRIRRKSTTQAHPEILQESDKQQTKRRKTMLHSKRKQYEEPSS